MARLLLLPFAALILVACGGDDGDGATIDAAIDAPPGTIDAAVDAPPATSALGRACMGEGQGDCPAGWTCLNLNSPNSSGRWCSKPCTSVQDMSCEDGYGGPGQPLCLFNVDFGGGNMMMMCAVVCEDAPGGAMLCPEPTECNGMCPGSLRCNHNIQNMQMQTLGKACL